MLSQGMGWLKEKEKWPPLNWYNMQIVLFYQKQLIVRPSRLETKTLNFRGEILNRNQKQGENVKKRIRQAYTTPEVRRRMIEKCGHFLTKKSLCDKQVGVKKSDVKQRTGLMVGATEIGWIKIIKQYTKEN